MNEIFNEINENNNDVVINETEALQEKPIGVYVKVNENGFITDVNSDIFINDVSGWLKIDEGFGDEFAHAQSHYFNEPLVNEKGEYTQKIKEG